jgi:hypothetical protein
VCTTTQEKLQRREWAAVGLTGLGIIGMGISTEDEPENLAIFPMRIAVRFSVVRITSIEWSSMVERRGESSAQCVSVRLLSAGRRTSNVGLTFVEGEIKFHDYATGGLALIHLRIVPYPGISTSSSRTMFIANDKQGFHILLHVGTPNRIT